MLPALERRHDVLALTLPGHPGGPSLAEPVSAEGMLDQLESSLDTLGVDTAHVVGNSLGGFAALKLAERGRARSVVALAPAGGWEDDTQGHKPIRLLGGVVRAARAAAPFADALLETPHGRRNATVLSAVRYEHIPKELLVHQLLGLAAFDGAEALSEAAIRDGWPLDPERITCPVRIVWGTQDQLLTWPQAAERFQRVLDADWVVLEDVGHCPQLDVPEQTAELILGFAQP
jgi:pimeloyl-ACP methyl ester carboxylesterase